MADPPGTIVPPAPPKPPAARAMDNYPGKVADAFRAKEREFFGTTSFTPDTVISLESGRGWFKIDHYDHRDEVHTVVFFFNRITDEVFEVHGTIARFYLELVRGVGRTDDFPIADTRRSAADQRQEISYFSRYSLRWDSGTNAVTKKFYEPYDGTSPHAFDPVKDDTLVACSEEYAIASESLVFTNWKGVADLEKYDGSIGVRSVGRPTQILLHETAGFTGMAIAGVQKKGGIFPVPHFCVNNVDEAGKGRIIQFSDISNHTPHGGQSNSRSVGIEFVNVPFPAGSPVDLKTVAEGLFVTNKLGSGMGTVMIPLDFSTEQKGGFVEIKLKKTRLANLARLKEGVGKDKKKVVEEIDDDVLIKFARPGKFEALAELVRTMVEKRLVKGIDDLAKEEYWKPVVRVDGKAFLLVFYGCERAPDGLLHYFFDGRDPGFLSHLTLGTGTVEDHVDGSLQILYLYLKFVRKVSVAAIPGLMIELLGRPAKPIKLKSRWVQQGDFFSAPKRPLEKTFGNIVELDDELIGAAAKSST
ncbi:hypothetical protein ABT256_06885 [Amycolatopsis japonica]|uniref:hypothetical protein n=1 Tax=Amycolatopsis japonica TaxID=208439 RepID=UPI0033339F47